MSRIMSTRAKLLASTALLAAAAGAAGLGTFGSFTSTTSASEAVTSGTVAIGVGTAGGVDNRLTIPATGVVPGDTIQRVVKLSNTGNQNLASLTLTTVATPATTALTTDATNGLQLKVDKCSTGWVEAGTSPKFTYTCGGTVTSIVASRPVIGLNLALTGLSSLNAMTNDSLLVTVSLPSVAGNALQNLSTAVNFTFDATQRAGTDQ
jgi:spore coat-associated protein N